MSNSTLDLPWTQKISSFQDETQYAGSQQIMQENYKSLFLHSTIQNSCFTIRTLKCFCSEARNPIRPEKYNNLTSLFIPKINYIKCQSFRPQHDPA